MATKIWKPCNAVTQSSSYSGSTSGCTNFQWQEASNWSDGTVPQQGDDIVFLLISIIPAWEAQAMIVLLGL